MKNVDWINDLKIRGGWGKSGSLSDINPTNAYTLYGQQINQSFYDINGTSTNPAGGLYTQQYGNPATTWEKDILTNIGFDATLIHNRIDLTVEWYKKQVDGLLFVPVEPGTIGSAAIPYGNSGDVQNKGIDAAITYHGSAVNNKLKFDITGYVYLLSKQGREPSGRHTVF